jgi:hypothetical protein
MKYILDITKFNYKEILDPKNELILIGLISIFIFIWIILYAVPGLLSNLFNTILGNIILLVTIILVGIKNVPVAIGLIILFIVLFKFSHYVVKKKEGYNGSLKKSGIYKYKR